MTAITIIATWVIVFLIIICWSTKGMLSRLVWGLPVTLAFAALFLRGLWGQKAFREAAPALYHPEDFRWLVHTFFLLAIIGGFLFIVKKQYE